PERAEPRATLPFLNPFGQSTQEVRGGRPRLTRESGFTKAVNRDSPRESKPKRGGSAMSVRYEVDGPIVVVTIDRPEVATAVDSPTADELAAAFRRFDADDALSVAVLTGVDGKFCAGADLKAMREDHSRTTRVAEDGDGPLGISRMLLSKPVIAAVEG